MKSLKARSSGCGYLATLAAGSPSDYNNQKEFAMSELLSKLVDLDYELSHFVHERYGSQWYWSFNKGATGGYANTLGEALEDMIETRERLAKEQRAKA